MYPAIFSYGFRPFFLAVGLAGLLLVPWWAGSFAFGVPLGTSWPPSLWHSHEMLFGFIAAAIAGFLLTAVPSWTGQRGFAGAPLAMLVVVWTLGRVVVSSASYWPLPVVAAVDLLFLPALAALLLRPLLRSRNRNTPLLIVLGGLWAADAAFFRAMASGDASLAATAIRVGIDIVLILVTVVGGRIVPAFTQSGLRARGNSIPLRAWRGMTPVAIGAMVAIAVVDAIAPEGHAAGALAMAGALLQAARMLQWRTMHTWRSPIVWVLHLAYAWLPVGLALKAGALLAGLAVAAFWLHALTIGALSTMILAVMTRATLGHTGRALAVAPPVAAAYGLLAAAALVRVFGLAVLGRNYPGVIVLSAILWTAAFAVFVAVYAPMLWSPRVDGRPG